MASLSPLFSQADYSVMEGWDSFLWGSLDGSSTPLLYEDGFNFPDKKARFALSDWVEPVEFPIEFDLHINNGRLLEHFHEGNLTNKSDGIQSKVPEIFVEVSPELGKRTWRIKRFNCSAYLSIWRTEVACACNRPSEGQ